MFDDGVAQVEPDDAGRQWVARAFGVEYGPFMTNAEAWREYDNRMSVAQTPAEARSAYWLRKSASNE